MIWLYLSVTWDKLAYYDEYVCNLKESEINLCYWILDFSRWHLEFLFIMYSCYDNCNN